jgi:hypothetical protein
MPKRGPNKRVAYLVDYFDYNSFGISLVNALTSPTTMAMAATEAASYGNKVLDNWRFNNF